MLTMLLPLLEDEASRAAFRALYDQYRPLLEQTARTMMPVRHDAEDAVQNAFVKIIRHFDRISSVPCEKLPAYLVCIVKNECIDLLRKQKQTVPLEDWSAFDSISAAEGGGYSALVACFRRLPESSRAALEMKILLGYSDAEIAQMLGLSLSATVSRISRGRKLLQKIALEEGFVP